MPSTRSNPDTNRANLLQDTAVYVLAKGIPGVLGLLSVTLFIRLVGPTQFGLFAILSATVSMWSSFASGWFYQGVLRYYSSWQTDGRPFRNFLWRGSAICTGSFIGVFLLSLSWLATPVRWGEVMLCLALGAVIIVQTIALSCWQASLRPNTVLRVELARTIISFMATCLIALWLSAGANALLAGAVLGYLASFLAGRQLGSAADPAACRATPSNAQAWGYGWPLSCWFLVQLSMPWFDRVMIEAEYGLEATGVFASLSEILTRIFSLLIYPITLATYPRLTMAWNAGDLQGANRILRSTLISAVVISLVAILVMHSLSKTFTRIILPSESSVGLADQPFLVAAITASGGIWAIALLAHKPLELQSKTRSMLVAITLALGVKILGNNYGIPRWGLSGAASASIAAGAIYCTVCTVLSKLPVGRT
jgi:O-antigen/teichoic acid export membrane protein